MQVALWRIAHARSGDKADRADIGLFAYDAPTYDVLKREVTAPRIAAHFASLATGPVEVYPLDNLLALKIVLNGALQGGAARSLREEDIRPAALMAEQARHIGQRLPLAETYTGLMQGCVENGEGDWDNAAVIQEIRRRTQAGSVP